jgi:hypothetical protein
MLLPNQKVIKSRMKKILITAAALGLIVPRLLAQNTPPSLVCPEPVTVECAPTNGAPVDLTATVSDAETNAVTVVWFIDGTAYQTNDLAAGTTGAAVSVSFSALFGAGAHEVTVVASDGEFVVSCTNSVTIVADTAPTITSVAANPAVLWPPNHKMRAIQLNIQATDPCGSVTCRVVSVTSSEGVTGMEKGDKGPDWVLGPNPLALSLRAERSGKSKSGRTYTVTVECTDSSGNVATQNVTVTCPHDQRKPQPPKPPKPAKPAKKPKKH